MSQDCPDLQLTVVLLHASAAYICSSDSVVQLSTPVSDAQCSVVETLKGDGTH